LLTVFSGDCRLEGFKTLRGSFRVLGPQGCGDPMMHRFLLGKSIPVRLSWDGVEGYLDLRIEGLTGSTMTGCDLDIEGSLNAEKAPERSLLTRIGAGPEVA
jgi:hypothetical protein